MACCTQISPLTAADHDALATATMLMLGLRPGPMLMAVSS